MLEQKERVVMRHVIVSSHQTAMFDIDQTSHHFLPDRTLKFNDTNVTSNNIATALCSTVPASGNPSSTLETPSTNWNTTNPNKALPILRSLGTGMSLEDALRTGYPP